MSGLSSTVSAATSFIDLATFSEVEGYLYGGLEAITKFVLSVHKANWFSIIPICLRSTGSVDFGTKNIASHVNRSGDYVLNIWFRTQIPQIFLLQTEGANGIFLDSSVRWTKNLMHNLFESITVTFNELSVHEYDSFWLDFNFQLRAPGAKRIGYKNMIGDIASMTTPVGPGVPLGTGGYFSVPLPFWFCEDSGLALPIAALPFNDVKINFHLRKWQDLVVVYPGTAGVGGPLGVGTGGVATIQNVKQVGSINSEPALIDPQTFAHYVVVHNDERVKMGDAPRDMLISQNQIAQRSPFKDVSSRTSFDLRFSHSIKLLIWAAQNTSLINLGQGGGEWSNYTTEFGYQGLDPMSFSSLTYENSIRFANGADYFSLTQPYYFSSAIPDETGYHMYSYALSPWSCNGASGSTNYSKLANVSISHDMSPATVAAAGLSGAGPTYSNGDAMVYPNSLGVEVPFPQKFQHVFHAVNWNIARVANGSLGHPIL
jgi:hypothetical protein